MVYREPDPKRTEDAQEDAENHAALERLAAVGMRKKEDALLARESERNAAHTRVTSARFRQRAWTKPRKFLFVVHWLACTALAGLAAGVGVLAATHDLAYAIFIMMVVPLAIFAGFLLLAFPIMVAYAIHASLMRRRDARELLVWRATLPFAFDGFVETLSLDHTLSEVRLIVRFVSEAPPQTLVAGLLGNLAKAENTSVRSGKHAHAIFRTALADDSDSPPNDVTAFIRELADKVLLPLHAVHPIAKVVLGEAESGQSWDFGAARDNLIAVLDR